MIQFNRISSPMLWYPSQKQFVENENGEITVFVPLQEILET